MDLMDLASLLFLWLNSTGSGHRPDSMRRKLSPSGIASILNYCAPRRGPPIYRVIAAMLIKRVEVRRCDQTAGSGAHLPRGWQHLRERNSAATSSRRNVCEIPQRRSYLPGGELHCDVIYDVTTGPATPPNRRGALPA